MPSGGVIKSTMPHVLPKLVEWVIMSIKPDPRIALAKAIHRLNGMLEMLYWITLELMQAKVGFVAAIVNNVRYETGLPIY